MHWFAVTLLTESDERSLITVGKTVSLCAAVDVWSNRKWEVVTAYYYVGNLLIINHSKLTDSGREWWRQVYSSELA